MKYFYNIREMNSAFFKPNDKLVVQEYPRNHVVLGLINDSRYGHLRIIYSSDKYIGDVSYKSELYKNIRNNIYEDGMINDIIYIVSIDKKYNARLIEAYDNGTESILNHNEILRFAPKARMDVFDYKEVEFNEDNWLEITSKENIYVKSYKDMNSLNEDIFLTNSEDVINKKINLKPISNNLINPKLQRLLDMDI